VGEAIVAHGGADLLLECGTQADALIAAAVAAGMPQRHTAACQDPSTAASRLGLLLTEGDVLLVLGHPDAAMSELVETVKQSLCADPTQAI